jgi:Papain family cysteine protease
MLDLRSQLTSIKHQGRRGTCVAFAATAAHEMLRGDGNDLSEEFLYWGAKQRDGQPGTVATTLAAAAQTLVDLGQPLEVMWPYDPTQDHLAPGYGPSPDALAAALARRLAAGRPIPPTIDGLKASLRVGQPPLLVVELYDSWLSVQSDGHIGMPALGATLRGGHAVLVAGFAEGMIAPGDHFVVRNSWGVGWGDQGYGYLPYRYVEAFGRDAWVLDP